MMFLLGRQAMLGQAPPTYRRSTTARRFPCAASVQATSLPAAPLPRTTTSYSSGCDIRSSIETKFVWVPDAAVDRYSRSPMLDQAGREGRQVGCQDIRL